MLLTQNASNADPGRRRINEQLRPAGRVLPCEHRRSGPGNNAVRRGERRINSRVRLKEMSSGAVLVGPLAPENELHSLFHDHAVKHGFAVQDAGLSCMRILLEMAQPIQCHGSRNKPADQHVRCIRAVLVQACIDRHHLRHGARVCCHGGSGRNGERQKKLHVIAADAERAAPDAALIVQ